MKISVIIATWNNAVFLKDCLMSIFTEVGREYEVIVVDDGSNDNTKTCISAWMEQERFHYIRLKKQRGAAYARNLGAKNAQGEYLLFLDADTVILPRWSKNIIKFFRSNRTAGAGQVKLLRKNSNYFDSAGELISPLGFLVARAENEKDTGQYDIQELIFSGKSAGMIVRKTVFDLLNGFDSDYIIFLEDTDFFWRIWLIGYEVYFVPSIVVYHAYGTEEKSMHYYRDNKVYQRGCTNTITTLIKNVGTKRLLLLLPVHIVFRALLALAFIVSGNVYKGRELMLGLANGIYLLPRSLKKRSIIQSKRIVSDAHLFDIVGRQEGISFYLKKARLLLAEKKF